MIINRKICPIVIIAGVVLLRAFVLNQNYQRLLGQIFSPFIAIMASILVFLFAVFVMKKQVRMIYKEYLSLILLWALNGVGIAFLIMILLTAIYNSSQVLLALIVDGPIAFSTGVLVGTGLWINRIKTY